MEDEINKKWNTRNIIEETIKSIGIHSEPSPETREELATLKITQKLFMEQNQKEHELLSETLLRMEEKIDKALEKKADVWVEKAFTYLLYTVGGILITSIIYLVIK